MRIRAKISTAMNEVAATINEGARELQAFGEKFKI